MKKTLLVYAVQYFNNSVIIKSISCVFKRCHGWLAMVVVALFRKIMTFFWGFSMKTQIKPLALGLCILGLVASPAFANSDQQQLNSLKHQIAKLQRDVNKLEHQVQSKKKGNAINSGYVAPISGPSNLPSEGTQYLPVDVDVPGQSFVSSGPYIGIPLEFSGSNLIINSPSINEDVVLLKMRKNIRQRLTALGRPEEADHSHILLSGLGEVQAVYTKTGGSPSSTDINLTSANLDAYVLGPSTWTSALIELAYDNNPGPADGSFGYNTRALNSRVYISKAFIVIGDFLKTPFYSTVGQMYVPFGQYSSTMVSDPLTKLLARTKARAILFGYDNTKFYASIYGFKGDSHTSTTSRINNGGLNLGYRFKKDSFNANLGGGVIANIADSTGMQAAGNTPFFTSTTLLFNGFGGSTIPLGSPVTLVSTGSETIVHRVPAYDLRGQIGIGEHIDLLGEYVFASTQFNPNDLSMGAHGAKPKALNLEAAYSTSIFSRPTSFSIGYGMTRDALALGLPVKRYVFAINTSYWKDTLQSLEFRHDIDYTNGTISSGSLVTGPTGTGKSTNVVTAQFDIYF